jgi:hypothetical protein
VWGCLGFQQAYLALEDCCLIIVTRIQLVHGAAAVPPSPAQQDGSRQILLHLQMTLSQQADCAQAHTVYSLAQVILFP